MKGVVEGGKEMVLISKRYSFGDKETVTALSAARKEGGETMRFSKWEEE